MIRISLSALSAAVALFAGGGCRSTEATAQSPMEASDATAGSSALYTAYNLWFENPEKMSSVNYHTGAIILAGSKVIRLSTHTKTIRFRLADEERSFSIREEFTNRSFASQALEERTKKFSNQEKEMIRSGSVGNGMSKEAVLVSWRYPPEHQTLSTTANTWVYWRNRFMKQAVQFGQNGKVMNVN